MNKIKTNVTLPSVEHYWLNRWNGNDILFERKKKPKNAKNSELNQVCLHGFDSCYFPVALGLKYTTKYEIFWRDIVLCFAQNSSKIIVIIVKLLKMKITFLFTKVFKKFIFNNIIIITATLLSINLFDFQVIY